MPTQPNILGGVTDWGFKLLILSVVLVLLPESPFSMINQYITQVPYLQYLNWFIPFTQLVGVMEFWLAVVTIYYGYMMALRYTHVIGF